MVGLAAVLWSTFAWALVEDDTHLMPNGAGISSPSSIDAINDNPAGQIYNGRLKLFGGASASESSFDPFGAVGRAGFGNGSAGGTLGVHTYRQGEKNHAAFDYGIGAMADSIQTAVGVGGSSVFEKTSAVKENHLLNVGTLVQVTPEVRAGATMYGILGGIDYWGSGASSMMSDHWWLSLEGATTPSWQGKTLQTAIGYLAGDLQLTMGYALKLDDEAPGIIPSGISTGVGIKLGKDFFVQGLYNHRAKFTIGMMAFL